MVRIASKIALKSRYFKYTSHKIWYSTWIACYPLSAKFQGLVERKFIDGRFNDGFKMFKVQMENTCDITPIYVATFIDKGIHFLPGGNPCLREVLQVDVDNF